MTTTTNTAAASGAADNCTILPDGSAFAVGSFPLPQDHWLYAPHEYEPGADEPKELLAPILTHAQRNEVVAAVRYAVRGATMCGKEPDFDPDALVQNAVYALCGSFGHTALATTAQAAPVAVAGTSLQHIHDLLYTAQRTTGDAQAQAIAEARIALSDLMTAPEPVLATRAWPKVSGVSRDEGHPRALLVFFSAEPTDDEMRAVHGTLAAAPYPERLGAT